MAPEAQHEGVDGAMLVMDLDGTLLNGDHELSPVHRSALDGLGQIGVVRVVATGRSLFAAMRVIDAGFPIDYLVYSSGVGTVRWPVGETVAEHQMNEPDARDAVSVLKALGCDFMIQHPAPDTHRFHFASHGASRNADFERRLARYEAHAASFEDDGLAAHGCSHIVIIEPAGAPSALDRIRSALPQLHVVRTTSPLDHQSRWIELYPAAVGKSYAAEALRQSLSVSHERVYAVGNDYNDEDLLHWSANGFVVANAPADLRARFPAVASNNDGGVAQVGERLVRECFTDADGSTTT